MIPDFNYAFRDKNYNKPQTIDQNKIIMQIKKDQCLMESIILKCAKKIISLEIKLVNIRLCECSW